MGRVLRVFWVAIGVSVMMGQAVNTAPPPVHLTPEQDHQRTMDALQITSLRRGVDNDPKSQYPVNYDEAKGNAEAKLPDPLILNNGKPVTTGKMWWTERRPEIVEYFDREIYGRVLRHARTADHMFGDLYHMLSLAAEDRPRSLSATAGAAF